jgi:hypothetical protein
MDGLKTGAPGAAASSSQAAPSAAVGRHPSPNHSSRSSCSAAAAAFNGSSSEQARAGSEGFYKGQAQKVHFEALHSNKIGEDTFWDCVNKARKEDPTQEVSMLQGQLLP